jgi:hypothetical protein
MKFTIKTEKIATALKWATKNLGPVNSRTGMTLIKETVEVNGEIKKSYLYIDLALTGCLKI